MLSSIEHPGETFIAAIAEAFVGQFARVATAERCGVRLRRVSVSIAEQPADRGSDRIAPASTVVQRFRSGLDLRQNSGTIADIKKTKKELIRGNKETPRPR